MSVTQALARKWRPREFAELVGQRHVVTALSNALQAQRLHHAYLFTGTRGVGKTTLARILAKAFNCETGITAQPCGKCTACVEIDAGRFVDLLEVDAATNTKVEEMRDLLDQAQYMPAAGRFKVYIIDEVHMLSRSAFNSMLKTLEEPPEHVKFILATTDPQKVPLTVLSRCLQFNLKQMPADLVASHLGQILSRENIAFEPAALQMLARAATGSMRDGLSLLDQAIAYGAGKVESAAVAQMLGTIDPDYLYALLQALAENDGKALMRQAENIAERSLSFDAALQELGVILHRIALLQSVPDALDANTPGYERIVSLARSLSPELVQLHYQIVLHGRRDLELAPDEYSGFTMTLLRMLAFTLEEQSAEPTKAKARAAREALPAEPVAARAASAPPPRTSKQSGVVDRIARAAPAEAIVQPARTEAMLQPMPPEPVERPEAAAQQAALSGKQTQPDESIGRLPPTVHIEQPSSTETVRPAVARSSGPEPSPEPTPTPALSTDLAPAPAIHHYYGNWPALVDKLSSSGVAFELARHCEVKRVEENRFELYLGEKDRQLLPYKDKLKAALEGCLGHPVRLSLTVGTIAGATVAAREAEIREDKQARAAQAIEQDPFVRQLLASFDAKVIESSIKPLD